MTAKQGEGFPYGPSWWEHFFVLMFILAMTILVLLMKPILWFREVVRNVRE